jgi:hypothetical protein
VGITGEHPAIEIIQAVKTVIMARVEFCNIGCVVGTEAGQALLIGQRIVTSVSSIFFIVYVVEFYLQAESIKTPGF